MNSSSAWDTPWQPGEDRNPQSPWHCAHEEQATVARTYGNGASAAWLQCVACGGGIRAVKTSIPLAELPPWSGELQERFRSAAREEIERRQNAVAMEREARGADWWARYDAYLLTPRWQELRRRVLARSRGLCEAFMDGCNRTATEVHHLTYDHVGDEPIFDLAAVCHRCHDRITVRDRENRKST